MTHEEIKEKAKEIEILETLIRGAEQNKEAYDRVFASEEIMIKDNKNNTNPIYITGKKKDLIKELLHKEQDKWINIQKDRLSKI